MSEPTVKPLSATNLAQHFHLGCDLYLHNTYHRVRTSEGPQEPSELAKATYERGNDWEATLFKWLDQNDLLSRHISAPLTSSDLHAIIEFDERDHFYLAGLTFYAPKDAFADEFGKYGQEPVEFGLAKPDLVEIKRYGNGNTSWRIVDAKASKQAKTSHHVQIWFYTRCLELLLPFPDYRCDGRAAVWLPPADGFESAPPSLDDLRTISIGLLADSLNTYLFHTLPLLVRKPHADVKWHFNPLCAGCPYESQCRMRAKREGKVGAMPHVQIADEKVLENLLGYIRAGGRASEGSEIEELHRFVKSPDRVEKLHVSYPSTMKRAKRILALPARMRSKGIVSAPVEAARTNQIQVIRRRNFTCPANEDVSVVISILLDPATADIASFCLSVHSQLPSAIFTAPAPQCGNRATLVSALASALRLVLRLAPVPRTQFYVFSDPEHALLQRHLISAALALDPGDAAGEADVRLCIGALCEGAALLATAFQPVVLSGALLDFLGKRGARSKLELRLVLERLGLDASGTVDTLRARIMGEVERIKATGGRGEEDRKTELGQLPRIVVLKREVERLLALPVAGYWNLPECAAVLLPNTATCPKDEDIFVCYRARELGEMAAGMKARNECVYRVLRNFRERVKFPAAAGGSLLVNEARVLSAEFMDVCRQEHLRKLFFMQQFETLAKLTELWRSRIDGCPEAPVLEYRSTTKLPKDTYEHSFVLVSGSVEIPSDKDRAFYDWLLVEDDDDASIGLPPEALFDDIALCGLMFPLTRHTRARWDGQHPRVRATLRIADLRDVFMRGRDTCVRLTTFGALEHRLRSGARYRLSPRLVDFNLTKVLSTLLELDLRCGADGGALGGAVPFVELVSDPRAFATDRGPVEETQRMLKMEAEIQSLFRRLSVELSVEAAGALMLKKSQRRAARRILANRLSVIWGPPGTGKTYTLALSVLRLLDVRSRDDEPRQNIIFLTAMTHAAIQALMKKIHALVECYRSIESLPIAWLDQLSIEHITNGNDHPGPNTRHTTSYVYAGTVYQLYNFSKKKGVQTDLVIIDEAGQLSLNHAALALRSLRSDGQIVIAGDSEQLAPIMTAQYPQLKSRLFGSILDCLMQLARVRQESQSQSREDTRPASPTDVSEMSFSQESTIVQLTENFRLNPDLGDFVSTIYSRAFKPQKVQQRKVATRLKALTTVLEDTDVDDGVTREVLRFLLALSSVMLRQPQSLLVEPRRQQRVNQPGTGESADDAITPHPISLALIRLRTFTQHSEQVGYDVYVRGEAQIAAALVLAIRQCSPEDDIFVATPHRIQRHAVREALARQGAAQDEVDIADGVGKMSLGDDENGSPARSQMARVTVDTVERLQGSEAAFVLCLFSLPESHAADLGFLLERRRLNVAISRAKTMCILITSDVVLRPSVRVLADEGAARGYAFLKAFEERAWSATLNVDLDLV